MTKFSQMRIEIVILCQLWPIASRRHRLAGTTKWGAIRAHGAIIHRLQVFARAVVLVRVSDISGGCVLDGRRCTAPTARCSTMD
ncbi:MAG: hypothetical protein U5M50_00075 [Sphingobium sp.]|nr:hypothetical protein [Sphingobium sp.]